MPLMHFSDRRFEIECNTIDVTSLNRPDEHWSYADAHGHEHYWTLNGVRGGPYRWDAKAELPTVVCVEDEPWYDEDGEAIRRYHYECAVCREHVRPRGKPDECRQLAPGLKHYTIDGQSVSRETFDAEIARAAAAHGIEWPPQK